MEYPKFKVCVRCFTFNQSKYIEDAMNGFTIQQTDFPFVCCIIDDASTDGEQNVIKKYMDIHFDYSTDSVSFEDETDYAYIHYAQHKENKNCYFAVLFLKENLYSKNESYKAIEYIKEWQEHCNYVALCEGDDYWICADKIQKQTGILDSNQTVDMCACGTICKYNGVQKSRIAPVSMDCILTLEETINGGGAYLGTNSLMYRRELDKIHKPFKSFMDYDYTKQILGAFRGGIYYIAQDMAVYRLSADNSWSQMMSKDISKFIQHKFKVLAMLQLLDKDTDYEYSNTICSKTNELLCDILMLESKDSFSSLFKKISFKQKILIFLGMIKGLFK